MIVGEGAFNIPILAIRQLPEVKWPSNIDVGSCWVGNRNSAKVQLKNTGGRCGFK